MLKLTSSIRTRVLAIVLVPTLALAIVGGVAAVYLINEGNRTSDWAEQIDPGQDGMAIMDSLTAERRLSLLKVAGDDSVTEALGEARSGLSRRIQQLAMNEQGQLDDIEIADSERTQQAAAGMNELFGQLRPLRQAVDAGQASMKQVYDFYAAIGDAFAAASLATASASPDRETSGLLRGVRDLAVAADAMRRSHALAFAATRNGELNRELYQEYVAQVANYKRVLTKVQTTLGPEERARIQGILDSDAYQTVTRMETAIIERDAVPAEAEAEPEFDPITGQPVEAENAEPGPLPVPRDQWDEAAQEIGNQVTDVSVAQYRHGLNTAQDNGQETSFWSWLAAAGIALVSVIAMVIAGYLSQRLVKRLKRLRRETLELSEQRLPSIMERLRAGEQVDLNVELPALDFGNDEVGQVADAFNRAQRNAVSAAVAEAETREGTNAVFLNIAHRSQVVVHRQLEVLDKAEYRQEDPEQLELLFQLDHLATRERRNAENLIILGGELPGRQWRNPVPLIDVVRSAVAETEDYARVRTSRLPDTMLTGAAVADTIHLLAELVDNATSFSPPDTQVEVFGNRVGRGVVVEVSDQGLGMSPEEMEAINAQLADPPEFGVMGLSTETRLGLFVVGRLAKRTGVKVRLVESEYGGVRAIVLIPSALLTDAPETEAQDTQDTQLVSGVPEQAAERLERVGRRERTMQNLEAWEPTQVSEPVAPPSLPPRPTPPAPPAPEPSWPAGRQNEPWQEQQAPAPSPPPPPPARAPRPDEGSRAQSDDRPPLPSRRRQESLAPQLADDGAPSGRSYGTQSQEGPSAEQSRDFMSAIQQGTTRARHAAPEGGSGHFDLFTASEDREGNGRG